MIATTSSTHLHIKLTHTLCVVALNQLSMAAPNPLPSGSTLIPSSAGSLPSTVADEDVSTSRADLHIDRIYTNPLRSIAEDDNSNDKRILIDQQDSNQVRKRP